MIRIEDFKASHIEKAQEIALQNYHTERCSVLNLPLIEKVPDLTPFAENGLGVAAFENNEMTGFLCSLPPYENAFRSTNAVGVFSPMGANGAAGENRAKTYALMYQAAGEKWAKAGASSHGICLYAHDKEAQEQFFRYGFGMRCVDAIRGLEDIPVSDCPGYDYIELKPDEFLQILPLDHMLDAHMAASPTFILRASESELSFMEKSARSHPRYFLARTGNKIAAFIKAEQDGETFICERPDYLHITGAFCLPEHRGKGVYRNLLSFLAGTLKKEEGYVHIGVDFESINPAAYGFWNKYFDAYTCGVVRRIDEHAVTKQP